MIRTVPSEDRGSLRIPDLTDYCRVMCTFYNSSLLHTQYPYYVLFYYIYKVLYTFYSDVCCNEELKVKSSQSKGQSEVYRSIDESIQCNLFLWECRSEPAILIEEFVSSIEM